MIRIALVIAILTLAGCCGREDLRIEGGAHSSVLLYDQSTDTLIWFNANERTVIKYPNWNRGRRP